MSHCSKPFSVDFLEFLMKRRNLKSLNKSAKKFIKIKKKKYNAEKETTDSNNELLKNF